VPVTDAEVDPQTDLPADAEGTGRSLVWPAVIGGALAVLAFILLRRVDGGYGHGTLTGSFYDVQAKQLLKLRWDMPRDLLGVEAFRTGSKWYMYFGPFPAFLRMPVMAVAPGLAGHLSTVSMTIAFVIGLIFTSRLSWTVRGFVRGVGAPVERLDQWATGLFVFGVGTGSVLFFLGSEAWVYHEAALWGAVLAIGGFDFLLRYVARLRTLDLVFAALLTACAILSRPPVAMGPAIAMGIIAVATLFRRTRPWVGMRDEVDVRRVVPYLLVAAAVPIVAFAVVNYIKFGSPFSLPNSRQLFSLKNPHRKLVLQANGGSLFGFKFVPTSLLQYLRPDALSFQSLIPGISFPARARNIGGLHFDTIEPTSSIPSSMPALTLLALGGIFGTLRPPKVVGTTLAALRAPLVGALLGASVTLTLSYIAQRYLTDFVPFIVVGAAAGLWMLVRWLSTRARLIVPVVTGFAVLVFAAGVINTSLAVDYHYLNDFVGESKELGNFVETQYAVHKDFPGGDAPNVTQGDELPYPVLGRGQVFVVGDDCDGVYWSSGYRWMNVGRSRDTGLYRLRAQFDPVDEPTWQPLVVRGEPGRLQVTAAQVLPNNRVRFGFWSQGKDRLPHGEQIDGFFAGETTRFDPNETYTIDVIMDSNNGRVGVARKDFGGAFFFDQIELTVAQLDKYVFPTDRVVIGKNDDGAPTTPTFLGRLEELPNREPAICKDVVPEDRRAHGRQ
jgi:hypothetical protein